MKFTNHYSLITRMTETTARRLADGILVAAALGAAYYVARTPRLRRMAIGLAATMLTAMLLMTVAFWLYSIAVILARARCIMIERESQPVWDEKPAVIPEAVEAR